MKRALCLIGAALLAVVGYVAIGPVVTIRAIERAAKARYQVI